MGVKLSVTRKRSVSHFSETATQMAEANNSLSDSDSSVTKNSCDCSGNEGSPEDASNPSTSKGDTHKKSFPLGCKKRTKSKEKLDATLTSAKSDKSKSKSGWTLRWRMKPPRVVEQEVPSASESPREPMIDLARFNPEDYPIEDRDELARIERAREIAEGIEMEIDSLPPCYRATRDVGSDAVPVAEAIEEANIASAGAVGTSVSAADIGLRSAVLFDGLTVLLHRSLAISIDSHRSWNVLSQLDLHFLAQHYNWHQHQQGPQGMFTLTPRAVAGASVGETSSSAASSLVALEEPTPLAHTQVDYLHCLVPDLFDITRCSFYWGKMDRYEAERLLDNKPDGTFLLRDSAQEEYLFSVSFRRYNRSLHARIEQWNHRFSFDSHDPGVFSSPTILGLIDHYKNPELCMFFEPTLTVPLHRNVPFSLQHLSRAVICSKISYDGIGLLDLPKPLKLYLKEYHYKQRIRVRRLDL